MYQDLRAADQASSTTEAGEPFDAPTDRTARRRFWSDVADVLLSMPAGIGIRLGG